MYEYSAHPHVILFSSFGKTNAARQAATGSNCSIAFALVTVS